MKKGFTLIELLASIVIIAVVTLITIPIILNVIEESKKKSYKESAKGYVEAIENEIASIKLKNIETEYKGNYNIKKNKITKISEEAALIPILDTITIDLKVKGKLPDRGDVTISEKGVTRGKFYYGDYLVTLNGEKYKVEIASNSSSSDISALEAKINMLEEEIKTNKKKIDELENQTITGKYETVFEGSATSGTYNLTKNISQYKYLVVYTDSTTHKNVSSWKSTFGNSVLIDVSKIQYESVTPNSVSTYVSSPYYNSSWYYFIHFTFKTETSFRIIEMYKAGTNNPRIYKIVGIK